MDIIEILSDHVKLIFIAIFSSILSTGLFLILRVDMYTGSNKILLSINPLLWLLFFIFPISGIIYYLKQNLSI